MDGKTIAIAVLAAMAVFLGGVVASGLRPEPAAYAQGGVYSTYLATTATVAENLSNFIVVDTAARQMIFYRFDMTKNTLEPTDVKILSRDFGHTGP
jgi:hypothetical protein